MPALAFLMFVNKQSLAMVAALPLQDSPHVPCFICLWMVEPLNSVNDNEDQSVPHNMRVGLQDTAYLDILSPMTGIQKVRKKQAMFLGMKAPSNDSVRCTAL